MNRKRVEETISSMQILVMDPDEKEARILQHLLEELGYACMTAPRIQEAWNLATRLRPALALVAIQNDRGDAVRFLKKVQNMESPFPVIVITRSPKLDDAVEMMKHGAQDFWIHPVSRERLQKTLEWLHEKQAAENAPSSPPPHAGRIVTGNAAMLRLKAMAAKVAASRATVFIQGESGTGKELFARYIHANSPRVSAPFLAVNCAALPENLLESELFGYEKGAFTGANRLRKGKFELAHGGTLLLDEVTEIPIHLQAKLLRVLQENEVDRLGGRFPIPVDVRVIATTNAHVGEAIRENRFRKDLYYRLNVIPLKIPPLRERLDDIPLLVDHFLARFRELHGTRTRKATQEAIKRLQSYHWPGNVRELENVIQRAVLLFDETVLQADHIDFDALDDENNKGHEVPLMSISEMERHLIHRALDATEGNRTRAAEILGISVRTLRNKLNEYRLQASHSAA